VDERKEIEAISDPTERAEKSDQLLVSIAVQDAIVSLASEHVRIDDLSNPEIRKRIVDRFKARVDSGKQSILFEDENTNSIIEHAVDEKIGIVQKNIIEIPRLTVVPSDESVVSISDFDLDTTNINLRPQSNDIYLQSLEDTNAERQIISNSVINNKEDVIENTIVSRLLDVDFIDYDVNAKLLYKLAGQAVDHFRSYLQNDDEVTNVVYTQRRRMRIDISTDW